MKSLNVKKIAALAAGTALFAAGIAAAGAITYSNTPIVSESGVPQAKIVVGEQAAASDGVVAANIAAMIGNLAWRSQAVTATVGNTAGVGCTAAGGAGAGTCAISNEKVWLNVTLPGVVSGAVEFRTLISDWVDKKLENRLDNTLDDKYLFGTNDRTPFDSYEAVKKFSATDFPALQTSAITDTYANKAYTEEQTLWARAITRYDDALKKIVSTEPQLAYQIKFTQDLYGIPISTCSVSSGAINPLELLGGSGAVYDATKCGDNDMTERHRVLVKFLGEDYIISQMSPPYVDNILVLPLVAATGCVSDSSENLIGSPAPCPPGVGGVVKGGSVKLAKESAYGIVHVGENLSTGSYYIKLADITTPTTFFAEGQASIQIFDLNNNLLKEDKVTPGQTYTWTSPDGSKIRVRVYKNNPGYYAYAKWSEMAIYSKEFELTDGQSIADDCQDWKVSVFWKNKDPTYTSKAVDSLRKIVIKNEDSTTSTSIKMIEGDTQNIICSPVVWQLQYNGLTLNDPGDYDTISMAVQQRSFNLGFADTTACTVGAVSAKYRLADANVLRVTSGMSEPFTMNTQQLASFYVNLGSDLIDQGAAKCRTTALWPAIGAVAPTCVYGTYIDLLDRAGATATQLSITPTIGFTTATTFTVTGWDFATNTFFTAAATAPAGAGPVGGTIILPPTGKFFNRIMAITSTGGTLYDNVPVVVNDDYTVFDGTGLVAIDAEAIGFYRDTGTAIWTQSGAVDCDFQSTVAGVTYDPSDGVTQPFAFGAAAVLTPLPLPPTFFGAWCVPGGTGFSGAGLGTCEQTLTTPVAAVGNPFPERTIAFREDPGNDATTNGWDHVSAYMQQQGDGKYQFVKPVNTGGVLDTTPDSIEYTGLGTTISANGAYGVGFITERGSKFNSISKTSMQFKYAKKLGEAQYFMKTSGVAPNEPIQVGPLGEGESTTGLAGGIVIKVTQITEDVGTCTAGAGGAACTVTGLDQLTATPTVTSTMIPTDLDTATNKLVVLDKDADRTATLIVVGGNTVNTVASEIITSSNINLATDPVVVRAIGTNRVLVAGYTADDTMRAGDQFIQALIAAKNA